MLRFGSTELQVRGSLGKGVVQEKELARGAQVLRSCCAFPSAQASP